ncbi:GFA family protein [Pelobacter seleniigenes]|uniref:GFA family protein n=1 Tax=Pelobacter seleniigenes TaxID=407188 RepID=UPI0004A728FC|nr:GFA family protein [Pelobacter seleniigenes]
MDAKKTYQGSCHCGQVTFEVKADLATAVRCNCSLCKRKGFPMVMTEEFKVTGGEEFLTRYQFNTMTANHYFCKVCGVYTHHNPRSNPAATRVNAGCLEGVDPLSMEVGFVDGAALS